MKRAILLIIGSIAMNIPNFIQNIPAPLKGMTFGAGVLSILVSFFIISENVGKYWGGGSSIEYRDERSPSQKRWSCGCLLLGIILIAISLFVFNVFPGLWPFIRSRL